MKNKLAGALLLTIAAITAGANAQASGQTSAPLKLVKTVTLPGYTGDFDHFAIDRLRGRILVAAEDQSGDTRDPVIMASAVPRPDFNAAGESFRYVPQTGSDDLLIYAQSFRSSSGTSYVIETGSSITPIHRVLSSLRRIVLLITPVVLIAAAFGGQMLMTLPLRPLSRSPNAPNRSACRSLGNGSRCFPPMMRWSAWLCR